MRYFAPTTVEEAVGLFGRGAGAQGVRRRHRRHPADAAGRPDRTASSTSSTSIAWWACARPPPGGSSAQRRRRHSSPATPSCPPSSPACARVPASSARTRSQNRSSLGGNLCNASPCGGLGARHGGQRHPRRRRLRRRHPHRRRAGRAHRPRPHHARPGEFVIEFELDSAPANTGDAYLRLIPRTEMDIAVVGAAARITLDASGTVTAAALAFGAVAPTVVRVADAESALVGKAIDDDVLAAVAAAASAACNPIDDKRGTITYRRHVAGAGAGQAGRHHRRRAPPATGPAAPLPTEVPTDGSSAHQLRRQRRRDRLPLRGRRLAARLAAQQGWPDRRQGGLRHR